MTNAVIETILDRLQGVKQAGSGQWIACCPAHEDHKPSLSIGIGEEGQILLHCHAGCKIEDICEALGIKQTDLFPNPKAVQTGSKRRLVETYDYQDKDGQMLYQVCRYEPKDFRQRRPDGTSGWIWKLNGVKRVLYQLPELLATDTNEPVFIVEGEKDVNRLSQLRLVATTNAGGAGKWHTLSDVSALHGRKVVILPDNDEPGLKHARQVADSLFGKALEVKILELPGLPAKGDVSDWLEAGHSKEELLDLVDKTSPYQPEMNSNAIRRKGIEPFQPFPVEVLPEPLRGFVTVTAKAIGCDMSYVVLPLITGLAAAIGNSRRIELKKGWAEPCVIWAAIIGESGTAKSPALDVPLNTIWKRQAEALKAYKKAWAEYLAENDEYKATLSDWKKEGRSKGVVKPDPPEKPICKRYCVSDTTVEALADRLSDTPRGLLLVRDELSGWLGSFNQYKGGKGGDCAHWLTMHGARDLFVDRKTGDKTTIYIRRAAVSITGGIQPAILRRMLGQEHLDNGLAARLLLAMPPRKAKTWTEQEIDPGLEEKLENVFDHLFTLEPNEDQQGESYPVDIPLTPPAKDVLIRFYNEHNQEQVELVGAEASAWSKLEAYAARLALVIHFVRWAEGDPTLEYIGMVDEQSMSAGVVLARWFGREARRVYAHLQETEEEVQQRMVLEQIERRGGCVSVRDWQRIRHHPTATDAKNELDRMVQAGFGTWQAPGPTESGGRPSTVFVLCDSVTNDKTPDIEPENGVLSLSQGIDDEKLPDNDWGEL